MKNDGKPLEKIVRIIQEGLKDHPNIEIFSNYRIRNSAGKLREFDIFIKTYINGILIQIVIECKSHNRPISVGNIEAFKGKCDRIPDIHRKIFVSENDYTKDAKDAAHEFGIDLFHLKDIKPEIILQWIPISQIGVRFNVKNYKISICNTTPEKFKELEQERAQFAYIGNEKKSFDNIITDSVLENKNQLWTVMLYYFMKNGGENSIEKVFEIPLKMTTQGVSVVSQKGNKFNVYEIDAVINAWIVEKELSIKSSHIYLKDKDNFQAGKISLNLGCDNESADIVVTRNKIKTFHTESDGSIRELKVQMEYDAKSDKFTPCSKEISID